MIRLEQNPGYEHVINMKMIVDGNNCSYEFDVSIGLDGEYIAISEQPNGGLNTTGRDYNELVDNIIDCIDCWESL
jgi:hypothetical protein